MSSSPWSWLRLLTFTWSSCYLLIPSRLNAITLIWPWSHTCRMNEWMNEWMNGWISEWVSEWVSEMCGLSQGETCCPTSVWLGFVSYVRMWDWLIRRKLTVGDKRSHTDAAGSLRIFSLEIWYHKLHSLTIKPTAVGILPNACLYFLINNV